MLIPLNPFLGMPHRREEGWRLQGHRKREKLLGLWVSFVWEKHLKLRRELSTMACTGYHFFGGAFPLLHGFRKFIASHTLVHEEHLCSNASLGHTGGCGVAENLWMPGAMGGRYIRGRPKTCPKVLPGFPSICGLYDSSWPKKKCAMWRCREASWKAALLGWVMGVVNREWLNPDNTIRGSLLFGGLLTPQMRARDMLNGLRFCFPDHIQITNQGSKYSQGNIALREK